MQWDASSVHIAASKEIVIPIPLSCQVRSNTATATNNNNNNVTVNFVLEWTLLGDSAQNVDLQLEPVAQPSSIAGTGTGASTSAGASSVGGNAGGSAGTSSSNRQQQTTYMLVSRPSYEGNTPTMNGSHKFSVTIPSSYSGTNIDTGVKTNYEELWMLRLMNRFESVNVDFNLPVALLS